MQGRAWTWHGSNDHRRFLLSLGEYWNWCDGADGQSLRAIGSDPANELAAPQRYQNTARGRDEENPSWRQRDDQRLVSEAREQRQLRYSFFCRMPDITNP